MEDDGRRCSWCVSVGLIVAISSGLTACVRGSSNAVSTMIEGVLSLPYAG